MMDNNKKRYASNSSWLITFTDLMIILLVLFILMYTYSNPEEGKFESAIDSFKNTGILNLYKESDKDVDNSGGLIKNLDVPDELEDQIHQMIEREVDILELLQFVRSYAYGNDLENELQIHYTERGIEFILPEVMLFSSGEADLVEGAIDFLNEISPLLEAIHNTIDIEGHTDNIPIHTARFPSNWDLSTGRANEVIRFLIEEEGLEAQRFKAVGYGEYNPIATNETTEGRNKNRRVVIVIASE